MSKVTSRIRQLGLVVLVSLATACAPGDPDAPAPIPAEEEVSTERATLPLERHQVAVSSTLIPLGAVSIELPVEGEVLHDREITTTGGRQAQQIFFEARKAGVDKLKEAIDSSLVKAGFAKRLVAEEGDILRYVFTHPEGRRINVLVRENQKPARRRTDAETPAIAQFVVIPMTAPDQ